MRAYEAGSPAYFATRASLHILSCLLAPRLPRCPQNHNSILTISPSACQLDLCTQHVPRAYHVFEREPKRPLSIA